ncbi:UDP-N-acetylglucosamine 2-epimerase [Deltaproteobacteria bacterium]|nr:UDP-N-acetylglucosamine 2-epimerase [Deltaproteobacteria bacterium]
MRKICFVLTARSSYTKVKPILTALKDKPQVKLQIVCAGSAILERYGKVEDLVEKDGFTISERIYMVLEAETLLTSAKSTGMGVIEFAGAFNRLKPDVVLVMADRAEVMASAIAAAYQNIPLAHVQGGEVSGNIDEKVRHAITKLADLHFPATERAKDLLIRMGEHTSRVFHTGCPAMDLAEEVLQKPDMEFDIYKKYSGVGSAPDLDKRFIVVMQHPVTTEYYSTKKQANETLMAIAGQNRSILWFWPNSDAGSNETSKAIRSFRETNDLRHVHFFKNMEPEDFLRLLYASDGIVGNSSVAIRECSYLGVTAVNIGSRQVNREQGPNVVNVSHDRNEISSAIQNHLNGSVQRSKLYGNGDAGKKIADVIASIPLSSKNSIGYL